MMFVWSGAGADKILEGGGGRWRVEIRGRGEVQGGDEEEYERVRERGREIGVKGERK